MTERPLRILTLATLFPNAVQPNFGIFVERQTAGLAAIEGMDVTVINPIAIPPWPLRLASRYRPLSVVPDQEHWRGLHVYRPRFQVIPKFGGPYNPAMIARAILPLVRRLHTEKPFDLIDAEFFYPDGPAAMRLSDALGIPFTIKARGADIHHWGSAKGCASQILAAADKAAGLLAVSAALKQDMAVLGMDAGKIMVHYTGLDQSRFTPQNRGAAKQKLGINAPLILSVGALIPRKNQALLIQALPALPDVHLMLAGQGDSETDYRRLAEKLQVASRLHFAGSVAHDDLPGLYAAADIMALVSKSEGLANAWVEALACGTRIIATNVGGAPELIRSPDAGRIVDGDPTAIVAAAKELLTNPIPQNQVAAQVAHFSWDNNARALAAFFRRLIKR
ncbi:glycosyltransferase [Sphingorhabdus arenilitoris]|uniref:Glycosyltransferase n=1 Tax=Sphingorhabdus arenilitoris TaxID=1490041 RepID=A0ABV8REP0_9SPHN